MKKKEVKDQNDTVKQTQSLTSFLKERWRFVENI